jgi:tyrosyl-tRNA synthetase
MDILKDLETRGLLQQAIDRDALAAELAKGPVTLYCGFDPTADSLHIGHLLPALVLRRFQLAGHKPLAVVGGATGLIGDPSGKAAERQLQSAETVGQWTRNLKAQLARLLDFSAGPAQAEVLNNHDWVQGLSAIEFLRDVGKHFSVNVMMQKESVSRRLEEGGISYTEFSYMLLQSFDFLHLFRAKGCRLQVGGSDQWGNITAGADLVRKVEAKPAWGLTIPLVTKADGTKFGKTESGAVWLDAAKTSPYEFYQFWLNTADADAVKYLNFFTFLASSEIDALAQALASRPERREAQTRLAQEVTRLIHGPEGLASAERITHALFQGAVAGLSAEELEQAFGGVPSHSLPVADTALADALVACKACPSKRQAKEDLAAGAVSVNGEKVLDPAAVLGPAQRLHGRFTVIRRGKKSYSLLRWKND